MGISFYGNPKSSNDFPKETTVCYCDICDEKCEKSILHMNTMLYNMHRTITDLQLWDKFIKNPPFDNKGFMFSTNDWIIQITKHPYIQEDLHSGGSFSYCMRMMEYIALNGWENFVANYSKKKDNSKINIIIK